MFQLQACAKIAAYLACVGLVLEFSHRAYWGFNKHVQRLPASPFYRTIISAVATAVPLVAALLVTFLFLGSMDSQSLCSLGLGCNNQTMSFVAAGATMAFGCVTLAFVVGLIGGYIRIRRPKLTKDYERRVPVFIEGLMAFLSGSVFEEIIFRGYIFLVFRQAWGATWAVVGSSALFSVAHLVKHRKLPVFFTINAFIFGLLAAVCREYTGSLWLPIGLHFGWNLISGSILGLPYSGRTFDNGVVTCDVSGPVWLTGGLYSLDAGMLGTLALMVAAMGLISIVPLQ